MARVAQQFCAANKALHDLKSFDCGKPSMNQFLSRFAFKHAQLGLSRTEVLCVNTDSDSKTKIAAYYTLAASTIEREELPVATSLPRYPVPVARLARVAVDIRFQQRGLGEKTLVTALLHAWELSSRGLPMFGVVIDILDSDAQTFYEKYNFLDPFGPSKSQLFITMKQIDKLSK